MTFLIRSLDAGGAERQLVQLAKGLDKSIFDVSVLTYYPGGAFASELVTVDGVRMLTLNKQGRYDVAGFMGRLVRTVRRIRPHIIHGYLTDANELACLLGSITGAKVVWGVRASDMDFHRYDWLASALFRSSAWLSPRADLIIANSEAGRRHHITQGYSRGRMIVIPNGIDVGRFRRDTKAGERLRAAWGMRDGDFVIGIVARLDPMKDHSTFLHAASLVAARLPGARFVIVGDGPPRIRTQLVLEAAELQVEDRIQWLGHQPEVSSIYNALDVAVSSSSFGEGFSNAVGEAMACEISCAVTDVGDAAAIVSDTGRVVPPRRPDLLCEAILELAAADRGHLGRLARARVERHFSIDALVKRTTDALRGVVSGSGARHAMN